MGEMSKEGAELNRKVGELSGLEVDLDNLCPHCCSEIDLSKRYCNKCGNSIEDEEPGESSADPKKVAANRLADDDAVWEVVARRTSVQESDGIYQTVKDRFSDLLAEAHDGDNENRGWARLQLASAGFYYKDYNPRERLDCEVCDDTYDADQTQGHHVSYLTDTTITVCYSCHRRIHHEDGFFDELKPDISRKEAKQLKASGYLEKKIGSGRD